MITINPVKAIEAYKKEADRIKPIPPMEKTKDAVKKHTDVPPGRIDTWA